jgi:site-specific recombinase XerD
MSVSCVEEIFAKYEKVAKEAHADKFYSGSYTPHVMRHTTATHLLEAGVPLAVIKNILGHASIQTTQVYMEITQQTVDKYMKEWSEKWFPKNEAKERLLPEVQNSLPEFLR